MSKDKLKVKPVEQNHFLVLSGQHFTGHNFTLFQEASLGGPKIVEFLKNMKILPSVDFQTGNLVVKAKKLIQDRTNGKLEKIN